MASRWATKTVLFLAVVLAASALCYIYLRATTPPQFTGQIDLVRRLPADPARRNDPAGNVGVVAMMVCSEKTLQSTARTLVLFGITSTPEELLRTAAFEGLAGTETIRLELVARNADQANIAVTTMAEEAQRLYSDAMNWEFPPSQRRNGFRLDLVAPARVFDTPSQAPMKTLLFAAIFSAALLVLVGGVSTGRSSGQAARWPRRAVLVSLALLLVSAAVYAYALHSPKLYCGRVKIMPRLSAKDIRPDYLQRLDDWLGAGLRKDAAAQAARTLLLFNITSTWYQPQPADKDARSGRKVMRPVDTPIPPEALIRMTKIQRIPDTPVVTIEVTSPEQNLAEITADVVASELQRAYRKSIGATDEDQRTGRTSRLLIFEEAHVFPVRTIPQKAGTVGLITAAASLIFLISSGAGRLTRR